MKWTSSFPNQQIRNHHLPRPHATFSETKYLTSTKNMRHRIQPAFRCQSIVQKQAWLILSPLPQICATHIEFEESFNFDCIKRFIQASFYRPSLLSTIVVFHVLSSEKISLRRFSYASGTADGAMFQKKTLSQNFRGVTGPKNTETHSLIFALSHHGLRDHHYMVEKFMVACQGSRPKFMERRIGVTSPLHGARKTMISEQARRKEVNRFAIQKPSQKAKYRNYMKQRNKLFLAVKKRSESRRALGHYIP